MLSVAKSDSQLFGIIAYFDYYFAIRVRRMAGFVTHGK